MMMMMMMMMTTLMMMMTMMLLLFPVCFVRDSNISKSMDHFPSCFYFGSVSKRILVYNFS